MTSTPPSQAADHTFLVNTCRVLEQAQRITPSPTAPS